MKKINNERCWTEIDLVAIENNCKIYQKLLPQNTKLMAVVKADAYGHGDVQVAKRLQNIGVSDFAVATLEEAIKLRENNIKGQILILGYTSPDSVDLLIRYDITQTLVDENYANKMAEKSSEVKCNFALDTGMNRIGLDADIPDYCEKVIRKYSTKLKLTGLFTHLCTADTFDSDAKKFTDIQIKKFETVVERISDLNLPYIHCLNSAGGIWHSSQKSVFARLGIILYGLKPDYSNILPEGIKPVLEWKSVVSMVKTVEPGETIGYGRTFKAIENMKIATVCAGYADGVNRLLSNKFYVLINGKKAPIVGRVCMDQFMVDVSSIGGVEMGTEVVLIGKSGDEIITADDMANCVGSIGYEIVCDISNRTKRFFKDN